MKIEIASFFQNLKTDKIELELLREIVLECGMEETIKWGLPAYQYNKKTLLVLQSFKAYSALLFLNGFQLNDRNNILVKTGSNTRVGRQFRPKNVEHILDNKQDLIQLITEAKSSKDLAPEKTQIAPIAIPNEVAEIFSEDKDYEVAFYKLSPGKQRAYIFHFNQAKQSQTKTARVLKQREKILLGKGLLDK